MKKTRFLETWEGTQAENKWSRVFIVGLIGLCIVLGSLAFKRETIVTVQPFTLNEEAWVTVDDASRSYKEAWGFMLAQLFGNVTPASVDFVQDRVAPYLSSEIYMDVMSVLEVQSEQIKNDGVSISFEVRHVEFENQTNKVFVYGYSFTQGRSGSSKNRVSDRTDRTYEFEIEVSSFLPVVSYIDTYQGHPRTLELLERMKRRNERTQERESRES